LTALFIFIDAYGYGKKNIVTCNAPTHCGCYFSGYLFSFIV